MDEDQFWKLVGESRLNSSCLEEQVATLRVGLAELAPDEILQFRDYWNRASERAFSWPLWDAACLLVGGLGDDAFMDFRSWVISLGREKFDTILADPDNLVELAASKHEANANAAEHLNYLARDAYIAVTGQEPPGSSLPAGAVHPAGERTDLSDRAAVYRRFPKLMRLHES